MRELLCCGWSGSGARANVGSAIVERQKLWRPSRASASKRASFPISAQASWPASGTS